MRSGLLRRRDRTASLMYSSMCWVPSARWVVPRSSWQSCPNYRSWNGIWAPPPQQSLRMLQTFQSGLKRIHSSLCSGHFIKFNNGFRSIICTVLTNKALQHWKQGRTGTQERKRQGKLQYAAFLEHLMSALQSPVCFSGAVTWLWDNTVLETCLGLGDWVGNGPTHYTSKPQLFLWKLKASTAICTATWFSRCRESSWPLHQHARWGYVWVLLKQQQIPANTKMPAPAQLQPHFSSHQSIYPPRMTPGNPSGASKSTNPSWSS